MTSSTLPASAIRVARPFAAGQATCANPLCNRTDRWFHWSFAVAMRTGTLQDVINRYVILKPEIIE